MDNQMLEQKCIFIIEFVIKMQGKKIAENSFRNLENIEFLEVGIVNIETSVDNSLVNINLQKYCVLLR